MRLNLVCTVGPVPSVSRDPFGDHRALPVGDLESRELQANSLFQAKFRIVFGLLHSVLPLHRPSRGRRTRQGNLDTRTWSFLPAQSRPGRRQQGGGTSLYTREWFDLWERFGPPFPLPRQPHEVERVPPGNKHTKAM